VSLSQGELYTFVTNKAGKGKKGSMVACIKGTKAKDIIKVLEQVECSKRDLVLEVTLDMAKNMEAATKKVFNNAKLVTDRFHVIKLAMESLQQVRIKQGWEELEIENNAIVEAKNEKRKYVPTILENDETPRQLLARSRYILAKKKINWTENQKERAETLFKKYPKIEKVYNQTLAFRSIYEETTKFEAERRFNEWISKVENSEMSTFKTVANTVKNNLDNILNFFTNRNTNANAESFNSKIKLFRANQRGVTDTAFFLFRLYKLFA
jgi:transposase